MKVDGLRIALFSGNYNYVKDGANQALNKLVEYLERHGATVRVYSPTSDTPAFAPAGTLISVPSISLPRRKEYRLALGLPRHIRDDILAFEPNIFHLSAPDLLGNRALALAEKMQVPAVASVHTRFEAYLRYYHLGWLEGALQVYFRNFYRRCQQIYAPSDSMAEVLEAERMSDDIRIWGRGIDTEVYTPARRDLGWRRSLGIDDGDVVITFVGRLVLEKGLDVFTDVCRKLEQRNIAHKVLVIGDGPEREWFGRNLPKAIFTGFLNGENLARAYASGDVFLNPSQTETFGNVTLEAMASGLPTVCTQSTGSSSLVVNGETGFLSAPDDLDGMVNNMALLIESAAMRQEFGMAARQASLGRGWDQILNSLTQNYLSAIGSAERKHQVSKRQRQDYVPGQ
ncbi:glycosyltransferase family 4 protein [Govanella unica]|uniref:Glycosyltransferase family 1 protein n=1 Tax=Govanella unica TaxID=2975056 RepID=A0A9X3Z7I4_9PROT|nr:glycosyltransferase family 1 protein [Govania unica]MDA5194191.1 glycosyltransferase family 1 protein [Govania unica]